MTKCRTSLFRHKAVVDLSSKCSKSILVLNSWTLPWDSMNWSIKGHLVYAGRMACARWDTNVRRPDDVSVDHKIRGTTVELMRDRGSQEILEPNARVKQLWLVACENKRSAHLRIKLSVGICGRSLRHGRMHNQ